MKKIYTVQEFVFDNEDERNEFVKKQESLGWEDIGQLRKNINCSFSNPDYRWYAKLIKYNS